MVGIEIDHRILVVERRLRLLEGDSVLPSIGQILAGVPDEPKLIYAYSVRTAARPVKGSFGRRAIKPEAEDPGRQPGGESLQPQAGSA